MFPEAAANSIREALQNIAQTINEAVESKGRAPYPALHVVGIFFFFPYIFVHYSFYLEGASVSDSVKKDRKK